MITRDVYGGPISGIAGILHGLHLIIAEFWVSVQINHSAKCGYGIVSTGIIVETPEKVTADSWIGIQTCMVPIPTKGFVFFSIKGILRRAPRSDWSVLFLHARCVWPLVLALIGKLGDDRLAGERHEAGQGVRSAGVGEGVGVDVDLAPSRIPVTGRIPLDVVNCIR